MRQAQVYLNKQGTFLTETTAKPHAKCRNCGKGIWFYKSKKGKWCVLSELGCGGDEDQVLDFHKCNKNN